MKNTSDVRNRLLKLQAELQGRLNKVQSENRREVEEADDSNAQLWETSEIRNDLNDEIVTELRDVNRALMLLDAGKYGICENCGKPIDPKRLEALPYAVRCISCGGKHK
jgi:DnaK suppressor protein